jgi:hypothetical protein
MTAPRMTKRRMELLLKAICHLECYLEEMVDDVEIDTATKELDIAWRVLQNKWGHLLDEESVAKAVGSVGEMPC